MSINQDNYEQFFLDFAEGNLSPEMEKELTDFLEANPDLKPVLEDFDPSPLPPEKINNDLLKNRLRKDVLPTAHIGQDNADEWMVRDVEGLLDESEANELKTFLSLNPAYDFDYKLFRYTKLVPDLATSYSRKNELKKKRVLLPVSRMAWSLSAAAAVILIFFSIRFFRQSETQPAHPLRLPIAEAPRFSSPEIEINSSFPVIKNISLKTGILSSKHSAETTRSISIRLKPIEAGTVILPGQTKIFSLNLSDFNYSPILTVNFKEKPLIAKVFINMMAHAREGLSNRANLDKFREADLSFWSLAQAGISGFNTISDRDIELYVRKDEDGKVASYALVDQERLILSKKLDKD